jgi:hypothetical protein
MNTTGTSVTGRVRESLGQRRPMPEKHDSFTISPDDSILITRPRGLIGFRAVEGLQDREFHNMRCFAPPSSELARIETIIKRHSQAD